MDSRSLSLARLQNCPGIGTSAIAKVVDYYRGDVPPEFFGRNETWYCEGLKLPLRAARALSTYAARLSPAVERLSVRMLTRHEAEYPVSMLGAKVPPPILSTHGTTVETLSTGSLTVVCSFGWENTHADEVKEAIESAVSGGYRLIAGHNRPVYQWALLAAKRNRSQSVMVLDRGLLSAFDPDMRRDPVIAARIWGYSFDAERCLAISPFRLADGWKASHGPWRDDLVAALADTIIVMGVRRGGVIESVCLRAAKMGKMVLAGCDAEYLLAYPGVQEWTNSLPRLARAGATSQPAAMSRAGSHGGRYADDEQ